jgi:hypothetical protein
MEFFWVLTPFSVVVGYQHFRGHFFLKMEAALSSETLVYHHNTTRLHNSEEVHLNLHHREKLKFA